MDNTHRLYVTQPTALTIKHPDGRELLVIHLDGTVTGELEDASEAAQIFVREVRRLMGSGEPIVLASEQ